MGKRYVTLNDVALLANVSVATASYVLNGRKKSRISAETAERVLDAAEKLSYRPNVNARLLKGKASSTIGLIIPSMQNYFYPELTEGITNRANELGYNIALFNTNDDLSKEKHAFDTLQNLRVSGIIVASIANSSEEELKLFHNVEESGIPVVCVDRYYQGQEIPNVSIDQRRASYEMTKQLIQDGHKKIAVILHRDMHQQMVDRRMGFEDAMKESKEEVAWEIFWVDTTTFTELDATIDTVLNAEKAFTGIYCACGDFIAVEIIHKLKRGGIRIPDDICVAGFDGLSLGEIVSPSLSTVVQPIYGLGYEAMTLLQKRIVKESISQLTIRLPYSIAIRESTKTLIG